MVLIFRRSLVGLKYMCPLGCSKSIYVTIQINNWPNKPQGCVQYRSVCKRFAKFPISSTRLLRNVCKLFRYWTRHWPNTGWYLVSRKCPRFHLVACYTNISWHNKVNYKGIRNTFDTFANPGRLLFIDTWTIQRKSV